MGKYDNFDNKANIKKAQKHLNKVLRKQDKFQIDLAKKELDNELLFSSCQKMELKTDIMSVAIMLFSDDKQVMRFTNVIIPYSELASCSITANNETIYCTSTEKKGVVSRSIIGGVLAGGVGAVIGGCTASSISQTHSYQSQNGFHFNLYLKDGKGYQCKFEGSGLFSNKIPKEWSQLVSRIQMIIDQQ